jgi:hypothetical protein
MNAAARANSIAEMPGKIFMQRAFHFKRMDARMC